MFLVAGPHNFGVEYADAADTYVAGCVGFSAAAACRGSPCRRRAKGGGAGASAAVEVRYRQIAGNGRAAGRLMAPETQCGARNAQYLPVGAGDVGHVAGGAAAAPYDAEPGGPGVFWHR